MWTLIRTALGPVWTSLSIVAVLGSVVGFIYFKGHHDGAASVQAKWDAAIAQNLAAEAKARKDAEKAITDNPKEMENDPNNRDNQ